MLDLLWNQNKDKMNWEQKSYELLGSQSGPIDPRNDTIACRPGLIFNYKKSMVWREENILRWICSHNFFFNMHERDILNHLDVIVA